MDFLPLFLLKLKVALQVFIRPYLSYSGFFCKRSQVFHRSEPYYFFRTRVIAKKDLLVIIDIYNKSYIRNVCSGIIEQTTVLPERIPVVLIIHSTFPISG